MLLELRIKDLAIIDEVDIPFSRGLNVLTGETGAGKSIIINAVNMLLGDRSSDGLLRTGSEEGTVEAIFDTSEQPQVEEKLRSMGITDTKEILIKRTVSRSGRSRIFVNGDLSTLSAISRIGETLFSVYGQHEHQSLQKAEKHIDILDEFGGLKVARSRYEGVFREMEGMRRELVALKQADEQYKKDLELMKFQSQEIASAHLRDGEEEELREQKRILANAEKLFEWTDMAENLLYSGDSSICEKLNATLQRIAEIMKIDPSVEHLAKIIETSVYQLEEVAYSLRDYRGKVDCDPESLESAERRLDEIRQLKQKYGPTIQEIFQFKERIDRQLASLNSNRERIEQLEKKLAEAEQKSIELASTLSKERKKVAGEFRKATEKELSLLGMGNTVFEIRFGANKVGSKERWVTVDGTYLGPKGMDSLEFYISPNVGEEPRLLSQIASGGELSRIMLAIKRIIASAEPGQTLIFDEVDAGIGGAVAEVVGKSLKNLSLYHQILCVTHLPQIACFADVHHSVTKAARKNRTMTQVRALNPTERIDEVARMLGGVKITEKTRAHAVEMIENAKKTVQRPEVG
ncbi:MAG: DNA repair protein RecN [Proteobacteria bacterium]|nr:DNA repair protein RecN [Pseudomonadota bacterium]